MKKLPLTLLMLELLLFPSIAKSEKIIIECSCKTKQNPSECSIATQEFQAFKWHEDAHTNENIDWDEIMNGEYCQRHKHDACMCDGEGVYTGIIKKMNN